MSFLRRHWRLALPAGLIAAAALYWLAFSFFGIQTLLFDDKVTEAGPTFDSGAAQPVAETPGEEPADATEPPSTTTSSPETVPADTATEDVEDPDDATEPEEAAPPEIVRVVEGAFGDRSHPGEGTAVVLNDGTAQRFLRLEEDFATDNGPDLNVYLSAAPADAPAGDFDDDFVDLGDLKGNIGSQNYEIPTDVDLDRYTTVVVWCVRFGVAFTTASLA